MWFSKDKAAAKHFVLETPMAGPLPEGFAQVQFGMGCRTGHAEVVHVVYDPSKVSFDELLKAFWESHDPTQGDRQGNDRGSQYRSVIFTYSEDDLAQAEASKADYAQSLQGAGFGPITTQIRAITSPSFTTSNTSPKTQTVIAASVAPA